MKSSKVAKSNNFYVHVQPFVVFQVEHIIVKPEMETVFIRLFPGAVVKGQKVGVNFVIFY